MTRWSPGREPPPPSVLGVFWGNPRARLGTVLCLAHTAVLGILGLYHTLQPAQLPKSPTPEQIWNALPWAEQAVIIVSFGAFLIGAATLLLGIRAAAGTGASGSSP
jgi:hypothetical protein